MIPKRQSDKVAIIGSSTYSLSRFLTDRENFKDYEVWGLNNLFSLATNPTRWFEIHRIWQPKGAKYWLRRGKPQQYVDGKRKPVIYYLLKLHELNVPVYMHEKNPLIKQSTEFPFLECLNSFPYQYFTCTMAWQMALAILMGFKRIELHGMEVGDYWERRYQKPCLTFWMGLAIGKGIDVRTSLDSQLLRGPFLYGFERENYYE